MQSNTSTETFTVKAGDLGEQLIAEHFKDAERTEDWFDDKKDGMRTLINKSYEVKTLRLNDRDQGFWIDKSQFAKLDNVDILYFIKIPESKEEGATLYECIDKSKYKKVPGIPITEMRLYHIDNCKFIGNVNDERTNTIMNASKKISKHGRFN